jgi:peptide/nickel transport system substrate-binding protein
MKLWERKLRLVAAAGIAAFGLVAAACSSTSAPPGSAGGTSGKPSSGGTATIALPAGVTYSNIFPFYGITEASVYNLQFQYLLYRPLYYFGGNNSNSVSVNYALSTASAPVYSDGGKTVVVNMKGWKWSDGESVDAQSLIFFLNMAEAEKANWYGYSKGLLPDDLVSYKATGPDQVTMHLNRPYSTLWFTYNQLGELKPMPEAWDVTSLNGKPGSGGCIHDSAADSWAKCKAVYTFLTAQSKNPNGYATKVA